MQKDETKTRRIRKTTRKTVTETTTEIYEIETLPEEAEKLTETKTSTTMPVIIVMLNAEAKLN